MRRSSNRALTPAVCLLVGLGGAFPIGAARADERPALQWSQPIHCMRTPKGEVVRVQCDGPTTHLHCLVAPNEMEGGGELLHVQECPSIEDIPVYQALIASGATIEAAVAETPPGYARSERGRAFQVKFDLLNRVYVGASWIPSFQKLDGAPSPTSGSPFGLGRGQAETGLHISALSTRGRARHDFRILEGTVTFKDLEINGLLFAYDYQHLHRRPAWWLSTFIGPARVHPISPPLGWGFRVLAINDRPPAFRDTLDIEFLEAHAAWNPWQSMDLYSHVRIETGADVGEFWEDRSRVAKSGLKSGVGYVGFSGAIRSRFSLGQGGLHSIQMDLLYRRPTLLAGPNLGDSINKINASFAYEGVLIAINDQPLSVRLAATGSSRDDPAAGVRSFELGFSAGLRFSFWAPPRVFEPMQELEDP